MSIAISQWPLAELRRLVRAREGSLAVWFGLAIVPLVAFIGLSTDAARGYLVKARLSQAVDAGALAGGRAFFKDYRDADIRKYFAANFPPGFMGVTPETIPLDIDVDQVKGTVTVGATANVPTTFLSVLRLDAMTVSARSVVQRSVKGMELALVMDNTGSMGNGPGSKIEAMKEAATDLVNILYGDRETVEDFHVSLVPYTATVNIGGGRAAWLNPFDATANTEGYDAPRYAPTTWKGCVQARPVPNDQTDDPPGTGAVNPDPLRWNPHLWATTLGVYDPGDNEWDPDDPSSINEDWTLGNNATGPNLGCGPAITPLTAAKSSVLAAIAQMRGWSRGGTMANLGLAWGWRTISPRWRGLWGGATPPESPVDYNDPTIAKVVVLLTDGVNQWYDWPGGAPNADYTAYRRLGEEVLGPGINTNGEAKTEINDRMLSLCDAMKAEDVTIYAVLFQVNDPATEALYQSCATSPAHFFDAGSNQEVVNAFNAIGTELSQLRLAE